MAVLCFFKVSPAHERLEKLVFVLLLSLTTFVYQSLPFDISFVLPLKSLFILLLGNLLIFESEESLSLSVSVSLTRKSTATQVWT